MSPPSPPPAVGGTQSAERALLILEQFTPAHPLRNIDELSAAIAVPRSTVYRLMRLLRAHDLVEEAGQSRYQLGPRAITMGYVARSQVDTADLWRAALGSLTAKTSETSLVLRRIGDAAVCVERAESDHPVRLSFEIGRAMPLHTGAGAKVLLAHSPAELQENYVDGAVVSARRQALRDELARIRSRGYGESSGEVDPGIWAVAAPVLAEGHGQHLAISVALPQYRLDRARRIVLRDATLEAAAELRRRLAAFA